jgi:hypothetical protein
LLTSAGDDLAAKPSRPFLLAVTEGHKAHVLLEKPSEHVTFEIPQDLRKYRTQIAATSQGIFLRYLTAEGDDELAQARAPEDRLRWMEKYVRRPRKNWSELYRLDSNGRLTPVSKVEWVTPGRPGWHPMEETTARVELVACTLSPSLYGWVRPSAASWAVGSPKYTMDATGKTPPAMSFIVSEILTHLAPRDRYAHWILSALLACAALWHQWPRRKSWAGLVAWTAMVLLFNLAGLLTYWALNHAPTIRCPSCGRKRGLNRPDCRACGALLPAPQPRDLNLIMA